MAETDFQKIVEQHYRRIPLKRMEDGFESGELRHSVIDTVSGVTLPKGPPDGMYKYLTDEEKIKVGYLLECGRAGAKTCMELLKQNFREYGDSCYFEYLLAGASEMGYAIGSEYGRSFYPELLEMRQKGIEPALPKPPVIETAVPNKCFGFTVHRYESSYEISKIQPAQRPPKFSISYDDVNERCIEEYSFPSKRLAKNFRRKWNRFIFEKVSNPPVKYGFTIENGNLSEIRPLPKDTATSDNLRIFDSPRKAMKRLQEIKVSKPAETPTIQQTPPTVREVKVKPPEPAGKKGKSRLEK